MAASSDAGGCRVELHGEADVLTSSKHQRGPGVGQNAEPGRTHQPLHAADHQIASADVENVQCQRCLGADGAEPLNRLRGQGRSSARWVSLKLEDAAPVRRRAQHVGTARPIARSVTGAFREVQIVEHIPTRTPVHRAQHPEIGAYVDRRRRVRAVERQRAGTERQAAGRCLVHAVPPTVVRKT